MSAAQDLQWRTTSVPPVEPSRFGRDHWSTFAYVEDRAVDHRGMLGHDRMRCHGRRHPMMLQAKGSRLSSADGSRYPTILAGGEELRDHDDYDCLDDLIAAGLLEVHMPQVLTEHPGEGVPIDPVFVNAYGKPIREDGELIDPRFVTGMIELILCAHAAFSLTDLGREVVSELRAHLAAGGNHGTFRLGDAR